MEWGKAKTILIITFLGLNILLAYQLWINESNHVNVEFEISAQETQSLLRSKGIRLDLPIPTHTPTLREITVQFSERYDPSKVVLLQTSLARSEQENTGELNEVLLTQIPHAADYRIDPILSDQHKIILSQLYNDLPMFDVNVTIFNKDGWLFAYRQDYVYIESKVDEREQRILSAHQAVSFLAENFLPNGAVISDITLGYHGQSYDSATQVLAPKWRITLENGDVYYVHGINGAVDIP